MKKTVKCVEILRSKGKDIGKRVGKKGERTIGHKGSLL
jgi:hypothetical protein